jgi:hypothetical protein
MPVPNSTMVGRPGDAGKRPGDRFHGAFTKRTHGPHQSRQRELTAHPDGGGENMQEDADLVGVHE